MSNVQKINKPEVYNDLIFSHTEFGSNMAQARADILIHLYKNKLIPYAASNRIIIHQNHRARYAVIMGFMDLNKFKQPILRAWHKYEKKMYRVSGIIWYNVDANALYEVRVVNENGTLFLFTSNECPSLIITEGIGLWGKQKGAEVPLFEGDIVEAWSEGNKGRFIIKWRQESNPSYILYPAWQHGKPWSIHATQYGGADLRPNVLRKNGSYYDNLELIGNIFENPELAPVQVSV